MFDALPLAAESFAAALDLVLSCVSADFARVPAISAPAIAALPVRPAIRDVAALDRALAEAGYLGGIESLERLLGCVATGRAEPVALHWISRSSPRLAPQRLLGALRAQCEAHTAGDQGRRAAPDIARELVPLRTAAPVADTCASCTRFCWRTSHPPCPEESLRSRHLRARGAVLATLGCTARRLRPLRCGHGQRRRGRGARASMDRRTDLCAADRRGWRAPGRCRQRAFRTIRACAHRRPGRKRVARSGETKHLFLPRCAARAGVAGRSPIASPVRELAFADLLRLPTSRLSVSTFLLEADALVSPSPFVDEVEQSGLDSIEEADPSHRIFEAEALCHDPVDAACHSVPPLASGSSRRLRVAELPLRALPGIHRSAGRRPYSLSALERYQDCPFKFFAADVLRLEEVPEDESTMSPRARGRFIHEVFQRFFEAWDSRGGGAITAERLDEARALMVDVAEPLLARLPEADAALERARLFGSAISTGSVEIVLGHEAAAPVDVQRTLAGVPTRRRVRPGID